MGDKNPLIYIGSILNDKFHGMGTLYLPNGLIFKGEFRDGICQSLGALLYENGDIYYG